VHLADGTILKLTRLLIRRGDAAQVTYYWFDERGRDLTETYSAKWYLLLDSITMHRSDGALIRLSTPLAAGESMANAEKRLDAFLNAAYPEIKAYIPGATVPNGVATP
jgi:EpsI family protein